MVRMAVHDLKTPLGNIELVLHEFERGGISPDDFKELIDIAKQSTHIMRGLVEDMLTVAVISQPQFHLNENDLELTPFFHAICSSFEQTAKNKSIRFIKTIPEYLPIIQADAQQLQHVVDNLISNAIKYTPYNGIIEFSAKTDSGVVIISVKDYGLGMTKEDISQAFQEFKRLSAKTYRRGIQYRIGIVYRKKNRGTAWGQRLDIQRRKRQRNYLYGEITYVKYLLLGIFWRIKSMRISIPHYLNIGESCINNHKLTCPNFD